MANKQRDWIIVNIDNPGFTPTDFKIVGLTAADTQLRPFDDYLNNPIITEDQRFKDKDGNFSKDKFKQYYDNAVLGYQKFSQNYDTFKYDLFDPKRKLDSEVQNPHFELTQNSNPSHQTIGILGRNVVGQGLMSEKELAQQSKIYDPITGTYSETSLDQQSLFKSPLDWISNLFSDPIVYATYESDGTHIDPISGREVTHKKGEFRVNKEGEFFTEKLAGRNIREKQIVSLLDTITSDTSGINKYDFFDSDGLDKSITGSLFSATASIAPLFIPVFGEIYSGALVARELTKAIPMLSGMIDSVLGTDMQNNSILNTISAKAEQFTGGTSQYSREKAFTFENISKLISDVANQWGQQKIIAKGINKLTKADDLLIEANINARKLYETRAIQEGLPITQALASGQITEKEAAAQLQKLLGVKSLNEIGNVIRSGKWAESAVGKAAIAKFMDPIKKTVENLNQIGADISLAYMAIISNTDVYQSLLEHGVTKGEASLFALGSTLGMFGVDKYLHLGELFFDELKHSDKYIKNNIYEMLNPWKDSFNKSSKIVGKNAVQRLLNKGKDFGEKYVGKYLSQFQTDLQNHTTGFLGKALGEGLEETAEELVTDFFKTLYEQLGQLGLVSQKDVGAFQDWEARYGMSLLGGALGGGIFYGVGAVKGQYPIGSTNEDILYHIRNGKTKDYLERIDEWERKGKFGSKTLSASEYTETKDDKGETQRVYLSTDNENESQNHFIAERVRQGIKQLDAIINGNQLNLTEDQLFENMIMSEQRYFDLRDWLQKDTYATNYYQTYQNLVNQIVDIDQQILAADETKEGIVDGNPETDKSKRENSDSERGRLKEENIKKLQDKKKELIKQKDQFLSGDSSFYYTRKMLFALDPIINSYFFPTSYEQWLKNNKNGISEDALSKSDKIKYQEEYEEWKSTRYKDELDEAFQKYLEVEKLLSPAINELSGENNEYIENYQKINELLENIAIWIPEKQGKEESKEDYEKYKEILNKPIKNIDDLAFLKERENKIAEYNKNVQDNIINTLKSLTTKLDPLSFRLIKRKTGLLEKDKLESLTFESIEPYFRTEWKEENQGPLESKEQFEYYLSIKDNEDLDEDQLSFITSRKRAVEDYNSRITFLANSDVFDIDLRNRITKVLMDINLTQEQKFSQIQNILKQARENVKNKIEDDYDRTIISPLRNILLRLYDQYDDIDDDEKKNHPYIKLLNKTANKASLDNIFDQFINKALTLSEETKNKITSLLSVFYEDPINNIDEILKLIKSEDSSFQLDLNDDNYYTFNIAYDYWEDDMAPQKPRDLSYGEIGVLVNELLTNSELYGITSLEVESLKNIANLEQISSTPDVTPDNEIIELQDKAVINSHLTDAEISNAEDIINKILQNVQMNLDNNVDYQFLLKLNKFAEFENPLFKFIKQITEALGVEGLEEELQIIDAKISTVSGLNELVLNDAQLQKFNKLKDILMIAQGYLYSASTIPSVLQPYGHNGTINELSKNNPDIKQKIQLPTITQETFQAYGQEISKYLFEIAHLKEIHRNNAVNKAKRFRTTRDKFIQVQGQLIDNLRPQLKFTIEGKEVDLLEGIDDIGYQNKPSIRNKLIIELLHKNFIKLRKDYAIEKIFEASKILEKLVVENTARQQVSKLDEKINYDTFTNYDRLVNVIAWLSLDEREWEEYLREDINESKGRKIVPLTVQQHASRVAASVLSSDVYQKALKYINDNKLIDIEQLPLLEKTIYISGVAGAGKSQVTARQTINFVANKFKIDDKNILITGTTKTIRENLKEAIGRGTIIDEDSSRPLALDILKKYITPSVFAEIMDEINTVNDKNPNGKYITYLNRKNNDILKINWDAIQPHVNMSNRPEIIVVDEATHFSSVELQLFDKIAKIGVLLLGDGSQAGYSKVGGNLSFENTFMWRTPKLGISLRDNNIQNQENQVYLAELLEQIRNIEEGSPSYKDEAEYYLGVLNNLKFRGHLRTGLYGTVFQKEITDEVLSKILDKNAEVAFIGSENTATYTKLNSVSGRMKSLKVYKSVQDIQGQEFDYVIVDQDFAKEELEMSKSGPVQQKLYYKYLAIQKLYTLISRAKVGSLIIDPPSDFGECTIEKSTAIAPPIADSLKDFTGEELSTIEEYLKTKLNIKEEPKEKPSVKPTSEEGGEDKKDGEDSSEDGSDEDKGDEEGDDEEGYDEFDFEDNDTEELVPGVKIDDSKTNENPEPEIDENKRTIIETSPDPDIPSNIPVYSFMAVLGAERGFKTHDGKKYPIWKAASDKNGPIRDMEIFLKEDLTIEGIGVDEYYRRRTDYERLLRYLISAIVNKKPWGVVSTRLTDFLTQEQYEGLLNNIFLVKRPPINPRKENRDLRISYIPDPSDPVTTGKSDEHKNPVAITSEVKLVAQFGNITVTLGLPLSPETAEKSKSKFEEELKATKRELGNELAAAVSEEDKEKINKRIEEVDQRLSTLDSDTQKYIKYINELAVDTPVQVDFDPTFASLFKLKNGMILSKARKNTGVVMSEPLIYMGNSPLINKNMRGRPVILVSSDLTKRPEQLMDDYIADLEAGRRSEIRMINLSTRGIHLIDLIQTENSTVFGEKVNGDLLVSWGELGMKFFGALWNFRANLIQFREAYNEFLEKEGINEDQLFQVLNALQIEYDNKNTKGKPRPVPDYDKSIAEKINKFNDSLSGNVRQFRLGYRIDEGLPSQFIGRIPKDKFYDEDEPFGIFIHPKQSEIFLGLLNSYFEILKSNDIISLEGVNEDELIGKKGKNLRKSIQVDEANKWTIDGHTLKGNRMAFAVAALLTARMYAEAHFTLEEPDSNAYITNNGSLNITLFKNRPEERTFDVKSIVDKLKESFNGSAFRDMMLLAIHGTTQSRAKFGTIQKASDAYFKHGILLHAKRRDRATSNNYFLKCILNEELFTLDVYPNGPTLQVKVKGSSSVQVEEGPEENPEGMTVEEVLSNENIAQLFGGRVFNQDELINLISSILEDSEEYDIDEIKQKIIETVQKKCNGVLYPDMLYYDEESDQIFTLDQYVRYNYGIEDNADISQADNEITYTNPSDNSGVKIIRESVLGKNSKLRFDKKSQAGTSDNVNVLINECIPVVNRLIEAMLSINPNLENEGLEIINIPNNINNLDTAEIQAQIIDTYIKIQQKISEPLAGKKYRLNDDIKSIIGCDPTIIGKSMPDYINDLINYVKNNC